MRLSSAALALVLCGGHAAADPDGIVALQTDDQLVVKSGDREVLVYQTHAAPLPREGLAETYARGGYLACLRTPAGVEISDDFPPDHPHHHGFWSAWTKTSFQGRTPDFWNMGDGTGRVEFDRLVAIRNDGDSAGFETVHRFVDRSADPPVTALEETWRIDVSRRGGMVVVDLCSTQSCATQSTLDLPEYRYGGFGFRGHRSWSGAKGCRFLAASGKNGRETVEGSRERWCWIGGKVDGKTAGLYVLCHPANVRFPQPVRAHPTMPFFCYSPPKAGPMAIRPGKPLVSRYRLIPADGEPDAEQAERWWKDYGAGKNR